ncbi:hypothetical protein FRC15_005034 [Serendipita sp. 397]|nr:hypothetical protein FRC15_005034 [Serendipita sp. 397]
MRRTQSETSTTAPTNPPKQLLPKERSRDIQEEKSLSLSEKPHVCIDETKPSMQATESQPPPWPKRKNARPSHIPDADVDLRDTQVNENQAHVGDGAKADEVASRSADGAT